MNLKEFSRLVGLSQTTVSRALSGYPEVKPETRERVQDAATKFGYHPNRSAIGLATGRAGAIGIVFREDTEFGPHINEFLRGLGRRLKEDGVDILMTMVDSIDAEVRTYKRLAASKRVDAVVLHSPLVTDTRLALLEQMELPFILHGRTEYQNPVAYLDIDNFGAIKRATSHLIDLGHRRIGMINGLAGRTFAEHRESGYCKAFSERGLTQYGDLIGNGEFTDEIGFRIMQAFLASPEPPTAVLAGSMMSALGAMRAIRLAGLHLGRDVSLIAHDDVFPYLNADNMVPTVSTTRSSIGAAGTRIGELVMQLLSGRPASDIREIWPVELVLRESTGPAPLKLATAG
jgi:LacI family transcriptional regulator